MSSTVQHDLEKHRSSASQHDAAHHAARTRMTPLVATLRSAQYAISVATLSVAICALDRSLVSNKWFSDEALVIAGATLALLVLPLNLLAPTSPKTGAIADVLTACLLAAAFVLSAIFQGQGLGSCEGPDMIGVFDNKRACRKMTGGVVLAAIDAVLFGASGIVGWIKK